MFYLTFGATSPIKGVDDGRVGIILLVYLEAQISAEDVIEV